MLLGYARVSTTAQDLERQIASLIEAGVERKNIWTDKRTGATVYRQGLRDLLDRGAREGDTIIVYTLDRLARNMRDTLNTIHELRQEGISLRTLADPIAVNTAEDSVMNDVAIALLALFAQMERAWNLERVAHARSKAGKSPGRPRTLTASQIASAAELHQGGAGKSVRSIAADMGVPRTTLARALTESELEPSEFLDDRSVVRSATLYRELNSR